ncbi:MAG: FHA domain-containing protein [Cyanothece sp. SIO1E1]|nr:FHA domain-containing protein [Cyanothece sp. SIO1E1]
MLSMSSSSSRNCCAQVFLQQNPVISNSLIADCDHDFEKVTAIIEPVLNAPERCQITPFYIQAVTTGRTTFLTTNLSTDGCEAQVIQPAANYLIGRSLNCAITIRERSVSRQHAVIGYVHDQGFFLTDVGSRNGTKLNKHRLPAQDRRLLADGDLIQLCSLKVEFFISDLGGDATMRDLGDTSHL